MTLSRSGSVSTAQLLEQARRVELSDVLAGEANLRSDGTLWSHAATLGSFVYGDAFTIDAAVLASVVQNFATGYPQKVPVDYEHETAKKDPARAVVPFTRKAGEIVEVKAVLSEADLNDDMRKQVAAEEARRKRLGVDRAVSALGLWIRWEPTQRALSMVKDREITEMSVVIHWDYPDKNSGEGQGPTLLSAALTNTPFLDDMVPVAASRGNGGPPAAPATEQQHMTTEAKPNRLMLALAALLGKPVSTEDEASTELTAQLTQLRADVQKGQAAQSGLAMLATELGETDAGKMLGKIRELKAAATAASSEAEKTKLAGITASVDAFLKEHESRIGSVAARDHFKAALTRELGEGKTIETAPTAAVVKSLPAATNLGQKGGADAGSNVTDDRDVLLDRRAKALVNEDAELKALSASQGFLPAYRRALVRAEKELAETGAGTTVVK